MIQQIFARLRPSSSKRRISSPCVRDGGEAASIVPSQGADVIVPQIREQAAVLALVDNTELLWHQMASLIEDAGSALKLLRRDWSGLEAFDTEKLEQATHLIDENQLGRYEAIISGAEETGASLVTVLEADYPSNLRLVYDRPPFLFVKGRGTANDARAIAVVGTRTASDRGLGIARDLAGQLVSRGVTVLSGLALGIDGAAHAAALDAGGRTVAVMGTGIDTIYPEMHKDLARRILDEGGTLLSQFWPWASPTRYSFPMRNRVMSGLAVGTVVVEAGEKSGARQQARIALEHGKRLFLWRSLVMQEKWAQQHAERPGAQIVDSVEDVIAALNEAARPARQMTLS